MDRLEHYLDQVCRSIGGPRSLRQHIRQELREHLQDAATQHMAAGLSADEAMDRALEDFGGPDQVRSELEATHGHRLLPVLIDRAMQWKEMTMKAKWFWTTWAYLAVVGVIALELFFIFFNVNWFLPKMQKMTHEGWLRFDNLRPLTWMGSFLEGVQSAWHNAVWWLLAVVAGWGLFEWRVRSDNKTLMRLAALGTGSLVLMVVVFIMAAALLIPYVIGLPAVARLSGAFAIEQVAAADRSVGAVEMAVRKKDWKAAQENAREASTAVGRLEAVPGVFAELRKQGWKMRASEVRTRLQTADECMQEAARAAGRNDVDQVMEEVRQFRELFGPLLKAVEKLPE